MSRPTRLKQTIQAEADRLGFPLVGVTHTGPPEHFPNFERWLEQGRHAGMGYLATPRTLERRADPTRLLPEARSVLSLAIPYSVPRPAAATAGNDADHGKVAAYAWGDDYHDVLLPRLQRLIETIETETGTGVVHRSYTDTGPILERDMAQRAGLGWIGKNTCLIHPHRGSYFLLTEILLDVDLEPDLPFRSDQCGTCTRCIDACPTGCIEEDRTIDSRRCISYLTIENKAEIPPELRPQMGSWVFGCDICQEVCPWNIRFAAPQQPDPELAPRPGISAPVLSEELRLSPEGFKAKFKGSPVLRAKRRGYLRNVAVALGNSANPASIEILIEVIQQEVDQLIRAHAAWALGRIGHPAARRALEKALHTEPDARVREEIQAALASYPGSDFN